jgi:hypothetical protein
MKLKLKRLRSTRAKGPYVYLCDKNGPILIKVGEEKEIPEYSAVKILKRDGDILEEVKEEKPKPEPLPELQKKIVKKRAKKQAAVKQNKMMKDYKDK